MLAKTSSSATISWTRPSVSSGPTYYTVQTIDAIESSVTIENCTTDIAFWPGVYIAVFK